jgi:hypothetical protein
MKTIWIPIAGVLSLALALPACGGDDDAQPIERGGSAGRGGSGGGSGGTGGSGGSAGPGASGEGGETGGDTASLEIDGTWDGDFGSTEVIDDVSWSVDYGMGESVATIASFSNDDNVAITQNPDDAEFGPSLFNRIVWTEIDGDTFYYCTTDFGLDTLEQARAADTAADDSHPGEMGCGGFAWTKLTRR